MEENTPPPASPVPPPVPPTPQAAPPVIGPTTQKQGSRGRGWMAVAIILFVLLGLSMIYNLSSFMNRVMRGGGGGHYAGRTAGPRVDEVIREDNGVQNKIAIIEVNGIIAGASFEQTGISMVDIVKTQLRHADEDDRVRAVVLKVDSPGGEVLASDEINRAIAEFQRNSKKPVVACMGTVAASGGYYISASCRWIVANELTITGSIGVIMSSYNYRGLMDKVGVQPMVYKSGKFKDMLSGSRPPESITPEERAMVQGLIDETFGRFKTVVREGRGEANEKNHRNRDDKDHGRDLISNWEDFADGRVLSGTDAFKKGFVDELGGFRDAVSRAKKLAGISEANLIQYQQRFDLSDFFRMLGKTDAKGVKIDLGVDMPRLKAGQLYFLAPTLVH